MHVKAVESVGALAGFFRSSRWRWWATAATLARLPGNMAPLGLILVLPGGPGAIAAGGFTVGIGLGAAWRGRAVDQSGPRAGLRREALALAGSSALLAAVIAAQGPLIAVVAAAITMGVAGSAVGMGYRAALPALVAPEAVPRAYLADAVLTELSFVASPVLAGVLATSAPPFVLFGVSAGLATAAVLAGTDLPDTAATGTGAGRRHGWLRAGAPIFVITAAIGLGYGLLMAGLPERLAELGWSGTAVSGVFAVMSATSAVAGLLVALRGGTSARGSGSAAALTAPFAVATAALALGTKGPFVLLAMAAFGLPLAVLSGLGTSALTTRIPADAHNRALAFFAAMVTVNTGIGFALAAVVLGHWGPGGVLAASAAVFTTLTGAISTTFAVPRVRARGRRRSGG